MTYGKPKSEQADGKKGAHPDKFKNKKEAEWLCGFWNPKFENIFDPGAEQTSRPKFKCIAYPEHLEITWTVPYHLQFALYGECVGYHQFNSEFRREVREAFSKTRLFVSDEPKGKMKELFDR